MCTEEIRRKKNNLRLGILELYISEVGGFSPALEQAMRNAKQSRHVIPIPTVESDRHLSQRLFAMLSRLLTKRAHKLLRGCESNNGLEAYRQLCLNYGSETDEKGTTGLMFEIISFKFGSEIGEVADLLTEFKLKIKQHDEAPSTEPVPDAVIKTVLVNNVPEPLLTHMRLNQSKYFSSYEAIKEIEQYCRAAKPSSSGTAPMEVDALYKGSGKNRHYKGDKGKGKQKGKDKTKDSGKTKTKNKHHAKDHGKGKPPRFEGYCSYPPCGKYGHKKQDCELGGGMRRWKLGL